ncbi:nitroreductase [Bradyrhizobium tropiciagri]|uniref:nitroreductase n=1 Tax=Bradyrhizobium tropiciagri TaxID=312253 RepID=UPI001BAD2B94|nr:nitroreductase [Bradyrhizobium tropiciagri]MBR0898902.1 nitroreductase [Bradyrhizobium tropiciagri]
MKTIAAPAPEVYSDLEQLESLVSNRLSCRAFRSTAVPEDVIVRVLRLAQSTASWCNSQPWQIAITRGDGTERLRDSLYRAAASNHADKWDFPPPREYLGVYLDRRRESGFQLYNALGIARGDKVRYHEQMLENYRFFGAPHLAVITTDEALGTYGAVDCGAYVGNFMLAATACGLGTVAQAAIARFPSVLRRELSLQEDRRVVCGISFGYPDLEHPANSYRTSRANVGDVVQWIDR